MLTGRGWSLVLFALALVTAGRVLGTIELYICGAAVGTLVVVSALVVAVARLRLEVNRTIHPPRVYAGSPSRVDITVHNRGRTRTPVLRLEDPVTGTRGARLLLGPLKPGEQAAAAYRLPTEQRGIVGVGPLRIVLADPFGIAEVRLHAAGNSELTVYPRIDRISPSPHTTGDDPHAGAEHPNALGRSGEDFYALRQYVVGDDLRRVHWAATARHDELMVRQDELPWQGRATILVDVRQATTTDASLELGISAAASLVLASWSRQDLVRLVSTDGTDSGFAAGHAQVDGIMEYLATVPAAHEGRFRRMIERLSAPGTGGALIAVVSQMSREELEALARLRTRFGWIAVLRFEPSSWDPAAPTESPVQGGRVLQVTRERPFVATWEQAIAVRRGGLIGTGASR